MQLCTNFKSTPPHAQLQVVAVLGHQLQFLALTQSVAVSEDSVEPIGSCKRLGILNLQGTGVEVRKNI